MRYLLASTPGTTAVVLSGQALHLVAQACGLARVLQPDTLRTGALTPSNSPRAAGPGAVSGLGAQVADGPGHHIDRWPTRPCDACWCGERPAAHHTEGPAVRPRDGPMPRGPGGGLGRTGRGGTPRDDHPVLIAALNGGRPPGCHPTLPLTPEQLAADAAACVAAGAGAIHVHPRSAAGLEVLDAEVVEAAVAAVRAAVAVPVGVSTGEWIERHPGRRTELVSAWRGPDMASVNFGEAGAEDVAGALLSAGVAVEAGIWSVADARRLGDSGLAGRVVRVLVEVIHPTDDPVGDATAIEAALDGLGVDVPRLVHGEGRGTWPVLRHAVARGRDTRIGLEDTLVGPDGEPAGSNAALAAAAVTLGAR